MSKAQVDAAYRQDYALERSCRDTVRALDETLRTLESTNRYSTEVATAVIEARNRLKEQADHIVAVWD